MIAAAKADAYIDDIEQQRIFNVVEQMDLSTETKGIKFDLLRQQISIEKFSKFDQMTVKQRKCWQNWRKNRFLG